MPAPTRSGSRINSWGASGGGYAPASGGSVSRAGASPGSATGRQSGAVESAPFVMRRIVRSVPHSSSLPAAMPVSASTASSESSSASWRGQRLSSARCGHCASPASGSQCLSRARSPLRSRSSRSRGRTDGRVQQAMTRVSGAISGASPPRPLGQQVVEREPEAPCLAARSLPMRRRKRVRFVGGALEHDVERVAGRGEGRVQPPRGERDEAVELFGAHHRAASIDGDQRDQRAVAADQGAAAALQGNGGLGREQTLQRLAPKRPAQALQVVDGGGERDPRARERHDASVPTVSA